MAATNAATDIGFATTFGKVVASVYTEFAEVTELSPPELSRDSVDFTHHGSPDGYREFKPGLSDGGEATLSYNLVPGLLDDAVIAAHLATKTVDEWRIVFPNGAKLDFKGFATAHAHATPMEDKMTGSATFKVSGKPVLTPAA
ncbi:MAG: phage tail protein [Novosphingobium sp. 17-62-19]|uniref:phage tail tube protein n=1 Tax=Novosphingobium sp. 17-62-19 TaxID=1970406 RepID=UPI000BCEB36D|nr:phage tail tube protein [Novosphingobium sp. 17-62-19]OZA21366.1 MAG: phage tail protein [Novosphingobium sp. 17-62-19]OZA56785.1 MAG: phage tail protein [Sphingomonadales bacterium 39-62-4]HQS95089.1 phage tail tube protein [Novosphingobium sp.]